MALLLSAAVSGVPALSNPRAVGPACPVVGASITPTPPATSTPLPSRTVHTTQGPVATGVPISIADLTGRIVIDDFENVFAMDVDGSNVVTVADDPAVRSSTAPGRRTVEWVVYRDSTRGHQRRRRDLRRRCGRHPMRRNITNNPANDWGPDWSPDGTTIVFNSDRDGPACAATS